MRFEHKSPKVSWHIYLKVYLLAFVIFFMCFWPASYMGKVIEHFRFGTTIFNFSENPKIHFFIFYRAMFLVVVSSGISIFIFWLERTHRQGGNKFRCFVVAVLVYIFCFCQPMLYFVEEYQISRWGHCFVPKKGCVVADAIGGGSLESKGTELLGL